jgi:hypothetical protein
MKECKKMEVGARRDLQYIIDSWDNFTHIQQKLILAVFRLYVMRRRIKTVLIGAGVILIVGFIGSVIAPTMIYFYLGVALALAFVAALLFL